MAREKQRIRLENGVSIFREFRTWSVDYMRDGKRIVKSLQETEMTRAIVGGLSIDVKKGDAHKLAILVRERMGAEHDLQSSSNPTVQDIARKVEQLEAKLTPPAAPAVPCAAALEAHLGVLKSRGRVEAYRSNVESQLNRFIKFAKAVHVGDVTEKHVIDYLTKTRGPKAEGGDGLGEKSAKDRCDAIRQWLSYAVKQGWLSKNVADGLGPDRIAAPDVTIYTAAEVDKLLDTDDRELAAAQGLAIFAGLRREEIHLLEWGDVNLEGRTIRVRNHDAKATKTKKARTVPILDQLLPLLHALKRTGGRVVTRWETTWGLGDAVLDYAEKRIGRREGLQVGRHSYCTFLLAHGVSASVAAQTAGHTVATQERSYRAIVPLGTRPIPMTYFKMKLLPTGIPEVRLKQVAKYQH